jgi:hypothetical protein
MPAAIGIVVRRRDWHRATALLILSLIHSPLWGVDRDTAVIWKEGSPYSDQLPFNGFVYKTIRVFDERDPSLSLSRDPTIATMAQAFQVAYDGIRIFEAKQNRKELK